MNSKCPRGLSCAPETACPEGRKAVDAAKDNQHGGCPWFVNDRESNYCFFKYLQLHEEPRTPAEIARLLLIDDGEVKKVTTKFKKLMQAELAKDDPTGDSEE